MLFDGVLLASDYDGTLVPSDKQVTKGVRDALGFFIANGGRFTVSTGRSYLGFHSYSPDIINAPVNRPQCVETTAMGAAYLAGLAVGYWSSKEDVIKNWAIDKTFEPKIEAAEREKRIKGWNKAVKYAYGWAKED